VVAHFKLQDEPDGSESLTSLPLSIKHLTLNSQSHALFTLVVPTSPWANTISVFSESPLESLTVKTTQSDSITLPTGLGADVVRYWGKTLRRLNAVKVNILDKTLKEICEGAKNLEQLTIDIPRDIARVMCLHSKPLFASFLHLSPNCHS
jgi:hypothetical protein